MISLAVLVACAGDTTTGPDGGPTDDGPTTATGDTGGGTTPGACTDPATAEVGVGVNEFESLAEGTPVTVVHGAQGGFHIVGAVRACNMDPVVTAHFTIVDQSTGATVADVTYPSPTFEDTECCRYRGDLWGYLETSGITEAQGMTAGEYLADKTLVMTMDVTDESGHSATDSIEVVASYDGSR